MVSEIIRWQTPLALHATHRDARHGARRQADREGRQGRHVVRVRNRDEAVFERPNEFRIDRKNAREHLAFGRGVHFCMGSRIAEMQLRVLWEESLSPIPPRGGGRQARPGALELREGVCAPTRVTRMPFERGREVRMKCDAEARRRHGDRRQRRAGRSRRRRRQGDRIAASATSRRSRRAHDRLQRHASSRPASSTSTRTRTGSCRAPTTAALVEPFVRQGMTTLVGGNCGFSPAPITEQQPRAAREASRLMATTRSSCAGTPWTSSSTRSSSGGVRAQRRRSWSGTGPCAPPSPGALEPAAPTPTSSPRWSGSCARRSTPAASGVSTGLGYPPGIFAGEDELAAFARWAAARARSSPRT